MLPHHDRENKQVICNNQNCTLKLTWISIHVMLQLKNGRQQSLLNRFKCRGKAWLCVFWVFGPLHLEPNKPDLYTSNIGIKSLELIKVLTDATTRWQRKISKQSVIIKIARWNWLGFQYMQCCNLKTGVSNLGQQFSRKKVAWQLAQHFNRFRYRKSLIMRVLRLWTIASGTE